MLRQDSIQLRTQISVKFNWLPWRYIISRVARTHGFLDPITLLAQLSKFSQPSEVAEPIELLRAGVVFHARGLINSRVIQHNLDWIWPYWVERQFDPTDVSFVPRAFSLTHVNLTHRNWTAIGIPNCDALPIVDPHGLLTPFWDKWSLDAWVLNNNGLTLLPSRAKVVKQQLDIKDGLAVITKTKNSDFSLLTRAEVSANNDQSVCCLNVEAFSKGAAWLVISLRPYNPEGISFIYNMELSHDRKKWNIDDKSTVLFDEPLDRSHASTYKKGDVYIHLHDKDEQLSAHCDVGMVTAAAGFKIEPNKNRKIHIKIPLNNTHAKSSIYTNNPPLLTSWSNCLQTKCELQIPDKHFQDLYEFAVRTLILCSPEKIYPGPYTYKRFWYRDAAFIIYGLLCAGLIKRAEKSLLYFPKQQDRSGYFHSQQGEWDSNGEVLWVLQRFYELTNRLPNDIDWWPIIFRGAKWICKKRLPDDNASVHSGLLPAGFSAEHLGPNDFYYWDNFWSIAGLEAATKLAIIFDKEKYKDKFQEESISLKNSVNKSLKKVVDRIGENAMPASPHRRLDAGAIGSLAAGYPLQIFSANDARLINTTEFLLNHCFVDNGFFQDMIHSGINPYLTLHVAQVLLRAGDSRYIKLLKKVANLASPTGQWPEAVHPSTAGGCMGDGQHAWAAAEWIIMLRNCFVREESNYLILCAGIHSDWLITNEELYFGPAHTTFGQIKIWIKPNIENTTVRWECTWRQEPKKIEVHLDGHTPVITSANSNFVKFIKATN